MAEGDAGPLGAGTELGPYRLDAELGSGGMGTVYRADGPDGVVAVKVVHPHLLAAKSFHERFEREARLGLAIRHTNVVRTLECLEIERGGKRVPALVLEYVEGRSLAELLREMRRVPEDLCRHIATEITSGLATIHAAGIVHRDLKPGNVIVTPQHRVKVMDLGLARQATGDDRLSATGVFVGTAAYAPPEQFQGKEELDPRSDLWSLGVILYELATGRLPFQGASLGEIVRKVLHEKPERLGRHAPQSSPFFEELVFALLKKRPEERPASAEAVVEILRLGEDGPWWTQAATELMEETRRPLRRIRVPRESDLWGREAELADLKARCERAKAGEAHVLLLEGEAGIGKSRLVDEFLAGLDPKQVHVLVGGYPPGGLGGASGGFTTAYGEHFGKNEDAIRRALPDTPMLVPAFAALLRGDGPPPGAEPLTNKSLPTAFAHATRSLAAEKPVVVVIDDLHFASDEGRALFTSLAYAVQGHSVLLIGAARPGLAAEWYANLQRLDHVAKRAVARLDTPAIEHRLSQMLGATPSAESLASRIAAKADGNPFFVFEMLRSLRESGVVSKTGDAWSVVRDAPDLQIPASIRDLVTGRLAGLDHDDREILEAASCQRAEFDGRLVAETLGRPRFDVLRRLGRLERETALVRAAGPRFAFDHHLVHEVVYESIAPALREEYHGATGEALERISGVRAQAPAGLPGHVRVELARHFLVGKRGRQALRHLKAALTHLASEYDHEGIIALIERALSIPDLIAGAHRQRLLLAKANHLDALGRREEQRRVLDEVLRLADRTGDASLRANARLSSAYQLWRVGRCAEAAPVLVEAQDLARAAGDENLEARVTSKLGAVVWSLGRLGEARGHVERSLVLFRKAGDRGGEAVSTGLLGNILQGLGLIDEARAQHERLLTLSRETGYREGEAFAALNLGGDSQVLGRFVEARDLHARSLEIFLEIGNRFGEVLATVNLGIDCLALGRPAAALGHLERCRAIARTIRAGPQEFHCILHLAAAHAEQGDDSNAERLHDEAIEHARVRGDRTQAAAALVARGGFLARRERLPAARSDFEAALGIIRDLQDTSAEDRLSTAAPSVEVEAAAWLAIVSGGGPSDALAALSRCRDSDGPQVSFLMWRATGDRAHLSKAKQMLDDLIAANPSEYRESMLSAIRLHREIAAAWAAQGGAT